MSDRPEEGRPSATERRKSEEAKRPQEECPICYTPIAEGGRFVTPCNHVFHDECIQQWFDSSPDTQCPLCRQRIRSNPELDLSCRDLTSFRFSDYPMNGVRTVFLSGNPLTEFSWEGAPQGLQELFLNGTTLTHFEFTEHTPQGLQTLSLHDTQLTRFEFNEHTPQGLQELNLSFTQLTRFEFNEHTPQDLRKLYLNGTQLTRFEFNEHTPQGLLILYLSGISPIRNEHTPIGLHIMNF